MALPDYVTNADAVMKDEAKWRHGRAPDYTKTRQVWRDCKFNAAPFPPAFPGAGEPRD